MGRNIWQWGEPVPASQKIHKNTKIFDFPDFALYLHWKKADKFCSSGCFSPFTCLFHSNKFQIFLSQDWFTHRCD
jgi:hypothetical protein